MEPQPDEQLEITVYCSKCNKPLRGTTVAAICRECLTQGSTEAPPKPQISADPPAPKVDG